MRAEPVVCMECRQPLDTPGCQRNSGIGKPYHHDPRPDGAHNERHRQESVAAGAQIIADSFGEPMVPLRLVEPLLALTEDSPAREALVDWLVDQDARPWISDDSTDQKGDAQDAR